MRVTNWFKFVMWCLLCMNVIAAVLFVVQSKWFLAGFFVFFIFAVGKDLILKNEVSK